MKSILITGASTGIGRAAAIELARKFRVFAGVRNDKAAMELKAEGIANLIPIHLDVTDEASIKTALAAVTPQCADGLHGLVNNAGIVVAGALEALPAEELRRQFDVNVFGLVAVTQAFLPLLRQAQGRIVNIGSVSGFMTIPFMGAYSASKFAVEAVSDALRRELRPQGVKVSLIEPGSVKTPIWEKSVAQANDLRSGLRREIELLYSVRMNHFEKMASKAGRLAIPTEHVVKAMAHALESARPKTRYLVGTDAKVTAFLAMIVPDRALDMVFDKKI